MDEYNSKDNNSNQTEGSFYAYNSDEIKSKQSLPPIYQSYSSQESEEFPRKPKKSAKKIAKSIGTLALCAAVGFGGGAAAVKYTSPPSVPVIYQAPAAGTGLSGAQPLNDMSDVAEKAGQSVVSIYTENLMTDVFNRGRIASGAGSGVILTDDGYIITNHHVIAGAQNITATLPDGTEKPALLIGSDALNDIAVLKIDAKGLTPAIVANSDSLRVGEFCLAIGNPMGTLGGTVTDGIISALNREIAIDSNTMNLLQMSAAVSPGNSGGGLFNSNGELIGIVNAKSSGTESEGLGFAIPTNQALEIAEALIAHGYVKGRPALGISARDLIAELGESGNGVYVAEVSSLAANAGLAVGDIIITFEDYIIKDRNSLTNALKNFEVGQTVKIQVQRGEQVVPITLTLQESVQTPT